MSRARPLRFAILGAGGAAGLHAAALQRIDDARLVAVAGHGSRRAGALAEHHGAATEPDLDALLARGDLDVIVIATPHPLHADQAVAAAGAGLHVVVEKPMALTPGDCDRMIAAAGASGVTLSVVSQRRWYEAVRRVKQAIDRQRVATPALGVLHVLGWRSDDYFASEPWRGTASGEGGGVLVNQAVHQLDLLTWFLGSPVDVDGRIVNVNHPAIEVEDTAVATVGFGGGAVASIVASNSQRPGLFGRIHVHGTNGASVGVETDRGSAFVAGVSTPTPARNDVWTIPGEEELPARWEAQDRARLEGVDIASHYHEQQLRDVVGAIRDVRPPAVSGEDGRRTVALFDAIYRSAATGQRVTVDAAR